jgi:type I restriction enzyme S subunit
LTARRVSANSLQPTGAAARSGWRLVPFGEVVRQVKKDVDPNNGGLDRYVAGEHIDTDDLRIRRWGTVGDGYLGPAFHRKFVKGQVLYCSRRTYLRKVAVADFDGICANTTFVLEPKTPDLLSEFLPVIMQSERFTDHSVKQSKGSVNPYINFKDIAWYEFHLPPTDEQHRIAMIWGAALTYEVELQHAHADLEELRKATILHVYSRGVGQARLVKTPLGMLPASWEVAPLERHYEVQPGKKLEPSERGMYSEVPCIRNANVQWNRLDLEDINMVPLSSADEERLKLKVGDIVACEGRHVGKSALWRGQVAGACYQNTLHRLRILDADQVPEFMLHCLQFYSWAGRFRDSTGETTIPHLTAEKLRKMLFPFPPKDEQRKIGDLIEGIGRQAKIVTDQVTTARRLKSELAAHLLNPSS